MDGRLCPLKREQPTRVSYNTLTHSRLYCREREKKVGHEVNGVHDVCTCSVQAKVLCTTTRAKKIVVGLTAVALTAGTINIACLYVARSGTMARIYAIVFRMMVPATVLVINLVVVREVRRRTSNAAADNLGVQHHQST